MIKWVWMDHFMAWRETRSFDNRTFSVRLCSCSWMITLAWWNDALRIDTLKYRYIQRSKMFTDLGVVASTTKTIIGIFQRPGPIAVLIIWIQRITFISYFLLRNWTMILYQLYTVYHIEAFWYLTFISFFWELGASGVFFTVRMIATIAFAFRITFWMVLAKWLIKDFTGKLINRWRIKIVKIIPIIRKVKESSVPGQYNLSVLHNFHHYDLVLVWSMILEHWRVYFLQCCPVRNIQLARPFIRSKSDLSVKRSRVYKLQRFLVHCYSKPNIGCNLNQSAKHFSNHFRIFKWQMHFYSVDSQIVPFQNLGNHFSSYIYDDASCVTFFISHHLNTPCSLVIKPLQVILFPGNNVL